MNITLTHNDHRIHVQASIDNPSAPNIIYLMTPVVSVSHELSQGFMSGLTEGGCNIFAIDFPGIGRSEGSSREIRYETMAGSMLSLIMYIQENYSANIHLYGGTGTGGIIGQALAMDSRIAPHIRSFSQFGAAIYRDSSPLADTRLLRIAYPLIQLIARIAPGTRLPFRLPEYHGLHAAEEDQWYKTIMQQYPGTFDLSFSLIASLCFLILGSASPLRNQLGCPTLVIASTEDRYFSRGYLQQYYDSLPCKKHLVWIASSHLAFVWNAEEINQAVLEWVHAH
ncbi:alpha/beta fold hydrolase [Spirochaeta africana]|uniref:Serine aminopeptidase S33 domain-containing protein n=1 Tax=Spirochaeta africana (strain ATCC 700263 / DSM 8902 / Z-7692) TaxID=889378 RepID=H9UIX2_SPIAZ|nr:alpha/beta hydrolase [Spirochaeta africana]AFG37465.1 hypothetical protein Spiaf_1400 [Spirochaeta africana DSM 8902]